VSPFAVNIDHRIPRLSQIHFGYWSDSMNLMPVLAIGLSALFNVASVAIACTVNEPIAHHHAKLDRSLANTKTLTPLWVGPAFSGSWYTPSRSGEGIIVQVLDNGSVIAIWFTFPPAGSTAAQAWILAQGGVIDGSRVRFDQVFTTRGPRFGPGFDPSARVIQPWGNLELNFSDCNNATVTYAGPPQWGSATRAIQRLTTLDELGCGGKQKLTASGARALTGLRQRSAAWFDPTHSGEGWFVEELPDGRAINYWFTYDEQGEQAWTVGVAERTGERIEVASSVRPIGTLFGDGFSAAQVQRQPWGSHTLTFTSCDAGTLTYNSVLPAFGSGTLRPQRLTRIAGAVCVDGTPRAPTGGSWSAGATMPSPQQSELATATRNGRFYVAGGFGAPRAWRRFDPTSNAWSALADLPGSRDHALAVAIGDDFFVSGGFPNNGMGDQTNNGWRYIESENRWEAVPELPRLAAGGGTALNGYAYFSGDTGQIGQFDPRLRRTRLITGDAESERRDHSQLVAFMGELWMIGGRSQTLGESNRVSIFDPASETWRAGPLIQYSRGGFAASTTATHIIISGGEVIFSGNTSVRRETEAIAAGENAWSELPPLPVAVHGVGGATQGNAFYALGGSTRAGVSNNQGQVQIYRWTP
jgi:N-acetylneuraminic acid mutarotase